MKNLKAPFLVIALLLLNFSVALANDNPLPQPSTLADDGIEDNEPCTGPCPEDFPIDQNIIFLLVGGLALGAVAIYKNQIKKASI